MKLPIVYVAGPYTNGGPIANTRTALEAGKQLWRSNKLLPFVPHVSLLWDLACPMSYSEWMDYDLHMLRHCGAVFRLPGVSPGADREEEHARELGIPVFYTYKDILAWAERL